MRHCWSNKRLGSVASSFDGIERCRERNYTARARGNRCSSENIQEATSWAGNTTVSKVSTIRKRWGRAEEAEKRTSFVDRKWRSELKTFLLSFFFFFCCCYYFFLLFFLFHADIFFLFFNSLSSCIFHIPFTGSNFCSRATSKYFRWNPLMAVL